MSTRALFLASLSFLACTKPDPAPAPPAPSVTASVSAAVSAAPPPPSASVAASSEPDPTATTPTAPGTAAPKTDGGKSAAASASAEPAECGKKPFPDCPLQGWMKTNANPPVMTSNLPALAIALEKMVAFAPPGYTNWVSISKDGAAAAKGGDLAAAKQSCRACHDQYKQKYKTEMRARKI